jgi:hypothetical protein
MVWGTIFYPSLLNLERQRIRSAVDGVNFGAKSLSGEKMPSGPWLAAVGGKKPVAGPWTRLLLVNRCLVSRPEGVRGNRRRADGPRFPGNVSVL